MATNMPVPFICWNWFIAIQVYLKVILTAIHLAPAKRLDLVWFIRICAKHRGWDLCATRLILLYCPNHTYLE